MGGGRWLFNGYCITFYKSRRGPRGLEMGGFYIVATRLSCVVGLSRDIKVQQVTWMRFLIKNYA